MSNKAIQKGYYGFKKYPVDEQKAIEKDKDIQDRLNEHEELIFYLEERISNLEEALKEFKE